LYRKVRKMADDRELQDLEREAYQDSYADGIIDLFVGVSLLWIGVAWIWLPDLAGLAGILPAIFVVPVLEGRKRFLEPRVGYVKWGATRRRWEQRNLVALLVVGVGFLLLGIAAYLLVSRSSADSDVASLLMPGLIALLLALLAIGLAFLMGTWRMLAYAGVLAVGGIVTAWADANPGWPLLAAGIVITVTGIAMLVRFIRDNPVLTP
jgi:hypothetical protein